MHLLASTRADRLAAENIEHNLAALEVRQPRLLTWIEDQPLELEWLFARDGTLSGREPGGRWVDGCSVPRLRSDLVLKTLEIRGSVACFLAPGHATDLTVTLERLTPAQALIVLVPTFAELAAMLHCHDYSTAINAGRLFFVAGAAWDVEFERLLTEQVGLATPSSFIRLPHSDEALVSPLLKSAEVIIAHANEQRAAQVARLRETYVPPGQRRVCIVAPMDFRLWNDFGSVVESIQANAGDLTLSVINTDSPASAAPHALLLEASKSDVLLTMNTARTDLPGIVPTDLPWITWVTGARIPSAALAGDFDRLLIAHPSLQPAALRAGWPADQIQVAAWPSANKRSASGKQLSLICDTQSLATPDDLRGYSSHTVLWETIRAELLANPFTLKRADDYLQAHQQRLGITDSAFSHARFVEQLIVPAYVQGLAGTLQKANIPFDLWGNGWDRLDGFAAFHQGPVHSRQQLANALDRSIAVVHPLVARAGHPILRIGIPVVAATDAQGFIRLARQGANGRIMQGTDPTPQLNAALIARLVDEIAVFS